MTPKQIEELIPVLQAYAAGKKIQYENSAGRWVDAHLFDIGLLGHRCRVKPTPTYRPFRNAEEFLEYSNKPIRRKAEKTMYSRWERFNDFGPYIEGASWTWSQAFDRYVFSDGTPFGILDR